MDEETLQDVDLENDDGDGTSEEDVSNDADSETKDPIDDIEDVAELRKLAKKRRAIDARAAKRERKTETKVEKTAKVDESKFVTKDDYYKGNERKATRALTVITGDDSEEVAEMKNDLKANWKDVVLYYKDISGRETVEDIVDDMTDAYYAFRRRNPKKEGDTSKQAASILSSSKGVKGKTPSGKPPKKQSILKRGQAKGADQMLGWFPKADE